MAIFPNDLKKMKNFFLHKFMDLIENDFVDKYPNSN